MFDPMSYEDAWLRWRSSLHAQVFREKCTEAIQKGYVSFVRDMLLRTHDGPNGNVEAFWDVLNCTHTKV